MRLDHLLSKEQHEPRLFCGLGGVPAVGSDRLLGGLLKESVELLVESLTGGCLTCKYCSLGRGTGVEGLLGVA